MVYRKEIDGLRALAVVPVILFHAGFEIFSGGFVGVDVFFVISGYLITSIIIDEIESDSFSLMRFYERRARRILPALFFVTLCTLPFAWLWMLPQNLEEFSRALAAIPLFSSNIIFWISGNYFDTSSEYNPLLHTWSLSVEEQYYFLFPIAILLIWSFGRKKVISILLLVAIISLLMAQWGVRNYPTFTFYMLPTRGFELLLGAITSLLVNHKTKSTPITAHSQIFSLIGLLLVLFSIFIFDSQTPSPSIYSLVPVVGTVLILISANDKNFVGRLLGLPFFVYVGLISFSAYLWHQPLFAFARLKIGSELTNSTLISVSIASLALGFLSWKYIETPFRDRVLVPTRKLKLVLIPTGLLFFILGTTGYIYKGFDSRFTSNESNYIKWQKYDFGDTLSRSKCFLDADDTFRKFKSECFEAANVNNYLIWGDSYAAASTSGFRATHGPIMQLTASGCPPLINLDFPGKPNCREVNNFVKEKIRELKPNKIFLQANWPAYKNDILISGVPTSINFIKSVSPSSEIILLGSSPRWDPNLPALLLRKKVSLNENSYVLMSAFEKLKSIDGSLEDLANSNQASFISILDRMCLKDQCLAVSKYKNEYWLTSWDVGHLTEAGSFYLSDKIKNYFIEIENSLHQPNIKQ